MTKYYKDGIEATEAEVKALHPNVIFCPTTMSELGWVVIFDTPQPIITELQMAYQNGTELDALGNRVVKWGVRDIFADYTDDLGVVHTKAEQEAAYLSAKFKASVPTTVTPRQARLALLQATLLDDVELLLATDKAMQIWWEYSLEIERSHTHIIAMGTALGLTERQLDDLFILAGTL